MPLSLASCRAVEGAVAQCECRQEQPHHTWGTEFMRPPIDRVCRCGAQAEDERRALHVLAATTRHGSNGGSKTAAVERTSLMNKGCCARPLQHCVWRGVKGTGLGRPLCPLRSGLGLGTRISRRHRGGGPFSVPPFGLETPRHVSPRSGVGGCLSCVPATAAPPLCRPHSPPQRFSVVCSQWAVPPHVPVCPSARIARGNVSLLRLGAELSGSPMRRVSVHWNDPDHAPD